MIPVFTIATIYHFVGNIIPFKNKIARGLIVGGSILLTKGMLIRQPFMDLIIGVPIKVVLLQQSQVWLSNFSLGIIIALLINPKGKC